MASNQPTGNNSDKKNSQAVEEARIAENCWVTRWPDGHISFANFPSYASLEAFGDVFTWELWLAKPEAKRALIQLLEKSLEGQP